MPINLKEIFVNDSNQIKVEKLNYNFDQIIGTGGQLGPKGPQGIQGNIGPVGPQGAQGPVGATGSDGNDGNDGQDRWYSMPHAAVTNEENTDYDTTIIKPKIDNDANQPTSVYIGDPTFNDTIQEEGDDEARASLVIGKKDPFENHIRLVTEDGFNMVVRGDTLAQGNYGGIFHIQKGLASNNLKIKGDISFDDVTIRATNDNAGTGIIELSANKTEVISTEDGFYTSIGTKSYFNDRVHVVDADLLVQGTGFTRISKGTTVERGVISSGDLSGGNLRYNSQTNQYEAYYENTDEGNIWLNLRQLTDADGDTYIELPLNNGDLDRIRFVINNESFLRIGGTQLSLQSESASGSTIVPTIEVNKTVFAKERIHFTGIGKGISFKEGPAATNTNSPTGGSAVNYATDINKRTLNDYFNREPGQFELENDTFITPNDASSEYQDGNNFVTISSPGDTDEIITNALFFFKDGSTTKNLLTAINGNTKIAYQKIGNLVNVQITMIWKPVITVASQTFDGLQYDDLFQNATNQEAFLWDDLSAVGKVLFFKIPELYKRLDPEIKVISNFTHSNLNIQGPDSPLVHQNTVLSYNNDGEYIFSLNNSNGFGGGLTVSGVKEGHHDFSNFGDQGNWIYSEMSLTYPCSKTSIQSNFPFNDGSSGGSAIGSVTNGGESEGGGRP